MRWNFGQKIIDKLRCKKEDKKKCKISLTEVLTKPYIPPKHIYKNLICTDGFGHSGSGVIIDLLSEFDNTTVYGSHDKNGGSPLSKDETVPKIEVDFIRRYGGVFDLERAFAYYRSASRMDVLTFIHLTEFFYKTSDCPLYCDKFMELTRDFIDKLLLCKFKTKDPLAGDPAFKFRSNFCADYKNLENPFIYNNTRELRCEYRVKNLSVQEYRKIAHEYIKNVFQMVESKDYLVLDGLLSDGTADFEKYRDFVGDYKQIVVYRDPRDVYMTGVLLNEPWIPRDKVAFVNWLKSGSIKKYVNNNSQYSITVRFEDLVLNYDETIPKVIDFLGLKKENHVAPKTQFRPECSIKNIGLYKNYEDQDTINYIEENLKEYCYYGE